MHRKTCEICGRREMKAYKNKELNKILCGRHQQQMYRCGKLFRTGRVEKNEIIIIGDIAKIKVYQKGMEYHIVIDKEDVPKIKDKPFHLCKKYARTKILKNGVAKGVYIQNLILKHKPGFIIDHIDRNPLNNKKSNLRYASFQQNTWNRRTQQKTLTNNTGVTKNYGKFVAKIGYMGKRIHLGSFDTLGEAVVARKAAEQEYFGQFAPI